MSTACPSTASPTSFDNMDVDHDTSTKQLATAIVPVPSTTKSESDLPPPLEGMNANEMNTFLQSIRQSVDPLLKQVEQDKNERHSENTLSLYYQQILVEALSQTSGNKLDPAEQSEDEKLASEKLAVKEEQFIQLNDDLNKAQQTISTLRLENTQLLSNLSQRDSTLSNQRNEINELRPLLNQVNELKVHANQRNVLLEQLSVEARRRETLEKANENSEQILQNEINELTINLTRSKSEVSKLNRILERIEQENEEIIERNEAKLNEQLDKNKNYQQIIDKLELELKSMRSAANELEESFKTEVDHLKKMCEIHENRTKEAEQRALDCEQALKQERDFIDMKREKEKESLKQNQLIVSSSTLQNNTLAPHVQALLSDMEKALDARWGLMEKQKIEVEKSRRHQIRAETEKEKLQRQVKDLRTNAENSRRDALRYCQQVEKQAEEMRKLQDKIQLLQQNPTNSNLPPQQGIGRMSAPVVPNTSLNPSSMLITPLRGNVSEGIPGMTSTPMNFKSMGLGRPSWPPQMMQQSQPQHPQSQFQQQDAASLIPSPTGMDIGPESVVPSLPVDMFASPPQNFATAQFSSTLREMSEVRRRHERLLESLRENRVSLG